MNLTRGQNTKSEQLVTRDVVMPRESLGIEPTTEKRGLTGYYLTPFVGVYRRTLPLAHSLEGRKQANAAVPDFLEGPDSSQYL